MSVVDKHGKKVEREVLKDDSPPMSKALLEERLKVERQKQKSQEKSK